MNNNSCRRPARVGKEKWLKFQFDVSHLTEDKEMQEILDQVKPQAKKGPDYLLVHDSLREHDDDKRHTHLGYVVRRSGGNFILLQDYHNDRSEYEVPELKQNNKLYSVVANFEKQKVKNKDKA